MSKEPSPTCVGDHQAAPQVPEEGRAPELAAAGDGGQVLDEHGLVPGLEGPKGPRAAVGEGAGVGLAVVLGPLGDAQGHHEGALHLDLDVGQGVEERGFGHQLLVQGVLQADGAAVGPADRQLGLQGRVQEQGVTCGDSSRGGGDTSAVSPQQSSPSPLPPSPSSQSPRSHRATTGSRGTGAKT